MDTPDLSPALLSGGEGYLASLDRLGLRPEGLMWVFDFEESKHVLWLVWSGVDKVGPLDIHKHLFAAYRASALPSIIDPFIVYVLSPKSGLLRQVVSAGAAKGVEAWQVGTDAPDGQTVVNRFEGRPEWTYRLNKKRQNAIEITRHWRRFDASVTALAA